MQPMKVDDLRCENEINMSLCNGDETNELIQRPDMLVYVDTQIIPDDCVRDVSVKVLLKKWADDILFDVKYAISEYYGEYSDLYAIINRSKQIDRRCVTEHCFKQAYKKIEYLTPVLEDLVQADITGIGEIFRVVYGFNSDELHILREYAKLYDCISEWDETMMWYGCRHDEILARNLFV